MVLPVFSQINSEARVRMPAIIGIELKLLIYKLHSKVRGIVVGFDMKLTAVPALNGIMVILGNKR